MICLQHVELQAYFEGAFRLGFLAAAPLFFLLGVILGPRVLSFFERIVSYDLLRNWQNRGR